MFICVIYIFGSLLEMAFIAYQDKKYATSMSTWGQHGPHADYFQPLVKP
jgi:hypothetical protein